MDMRRRRVVVEADQREIVRNRNVAFLRRAQDAIGHLICGGEYRGGTFFYR